MVGATGSFVAVAKHHREGHGGVGKWECIVAVTMATHHWQWRCGTGGRSLVGVVTVRQCGRQPVWLRARAHGMRVGPNFAVAIAAAVLMVCVPCECVCCLRVVPIALATVRML